MLSDLARELYEKNAIERIEKHFADRLAAMKQALDATAVAQQEAFQRVYELRQQADVLERAVEQRRAEHERKLAEQRAQQEAAQND